MIKENILTLPPIMIDGGMKIKWNIKTSGIYTWLNTTNNKMYIGRSVNLYKRIYGEMNGFQNNKVQNMKKLFNAIRKYGIGNFKVFLLKECPIEDLNKEERYFIELYNTKNNGYNCTFGGDGTHGHTVTKEQIQRQRKALKQYWTEDKKKEHKEKMKIWFNNQPDNIKKNMTTGNGWWLTEEGRRKQAKGCRLSKTPERIEKQRQSLINYYKNNISARSIITKVISPDGNIKIVNGSGKFCSENNIPYLSFRKLLHGKTQNYKGWRLVKNET